MDDLASVQSLRLSRRGVVGAAVGLVIGAGLVSTPATAASATILGKLSIDARSFRGRTFNVVGAASTLETRRALSRSALVVPPGTGPLDVNTDLVVVGERVMARGPLRWIHRVTVGDTATLICTGAAATQYEVVRRVIVARKSRPQGYLWEPQDPAVLVWNTTSVPSLTLLTQTKLNGLPTSGKYMMLVGLLRQN